MSFCFAQQRNIKGNVSDSAGAPLQGVNIAVKGEGRATQSNSSGEFTITATDRAVLVFTSIGYNRQEVTVGQLNELSVVLKPDSKNLTEVVVTALGQSSKKEKLGYATASFNTEAINRTANVNAFDGLAGKIAGAEISNTGGPGSSTKIVLRGYGVISGGDNQPLYVVDGIPFSNGRGTSSVIDLDSQNDFGNGANDINPNDIETITVLKGTAASSIYGSSAKNGAILITTKKGKAGKLKVDFAGSANFSTVGKLPTMQDQFGQGWSGTFVLPENGSWGPRLDGKERAWGAIVDNSQLIKPFSFIKDNVRNFYDLGEEYNNTIAISGGNEKSTFYFSYGNAVSDGVVPTNTDYLARNNFALRSNNKFGNFTLNSSFNYVNKKVSQPFTGQGTSDGSTIFQDILQIPVDIPIEDFRDYHNKFFNIDNYFSPYAENPYYGINENRARTNSDRFFGNIDLGYQFTKKLSAQFRLGADIDNARGFAYKAVNDPAPGSWNKGGNTEGTSRSKDVGSVTERSVYTGAINGDFIVKYTTDIASDFNLETLVGANFFQREARGVVSRITDLLIPGFYNLSNSTKDPTTSDARNKSRLFGVYAQTTLGFRNQLYLTLNARNDWSSTLPIDNNRFFYPGGSLSWVASNTFDLTNTAISFLKFRAGYGKTGTSAPVYSVNPVLLVGVVPLPFGEIDFPFGGVSSFQVQNVIANDKLKPIITSEAELGLELKLFKNRIGLDVAVYDKRTDGQIFNAPISPGSGYASLTQNIGLVTNKGIEISFNATPVETGKFSWNINYNFSKNINNVESLTDGVNKISIFQITGGPEIAAKPGSPVTGIYAFKPQYTPDGKIIVSQATGRPIVGTDREYMGNGENDYIMGLTNTLKYKSWQLNFSLDYRKGGVFYSKTAEQLLFTGNAYVTTYNDRRPFVVPNSVYLSGVDANGQPNYLENTTVITEEALNEYFPDNSNPAFAYAHDILDRSFLKLRDASLSYSLPRGIASKIRASNLTLTVYVRNLLLWTPASNLYIDPEATNFGNDITSQFGEFETAPVSRQFGVALKASF